MASKTMQQGAELRPPFKLALTVSKRVAKMVNSTIDGTVSVAGKSAKAVCNK